MQIIAHRGVSAHHHENSLKSISEALNLNIQGIEVDVHQVQDDFVIYHDFTLQRLIGIDTELSKMSLSDLQKIKLAEQQKIPTLGDILSLIDGKMPINLEVKAISKYESFVAKLVHYVYQTNGVIILSSFNHLVIKELQFFIRNTRVGNNIRFGVLIAHLPIDYAQYSVDIEADIAAIDAWLVDRNFVEHAHMNNKEVWCYTVNSIQQAKRLEEIGVDAIFTNDPELMLNELK